MSAVWSNSISLVQVCRNEWKLGLSNGNFVVMRNWLDWHDIVLEAIQVMMIISLQLCGSEDVNRVLSKDIF